MKALIMTNIADISKKGCDGGYGGRGGGSGGGGRTEYPTRNSWTLYWMRSRITIS